MSKLYKCQNNETDIVLNYFGKGFKGTLLEVGANNGFDLSNSYDLIEMGWKAHLLEPGSTFYTLRDLHCNNDEVYAYNFGIGICPNGGVKLKFHESGAHVSGGNDIGLVSSVLESETVKWKNKGVQFVESEIQIYNFKDFMDISGCNKFDYISIDVEGLEAQVLFQVDFKAVGCRLLCIEWNSKAHLAQTFTSYMNKFGMKEIHRNAENLLFCKK